MSTETDNVNWFTLLLTEC